MWLWWDPPTTTGRAARGRGNRRLGQRPGMSPERRLTLPTSPPTVTSVAMIAQRSAYASVVAGAVAVAAIAWALVQWGSGSPGPAVVVSLVGCLVGFALALVAEAAGSDRRDLRIGLAGLIGNALIAAWWALLFVAAWTGS
jgi:hypothetical protein